jgi:hypothetical protein
MELEMVVNVARRWSAAIPWNFIHEELVRLYDDWFSVPTILLAIWVACIVVLPILSGMRLQVFQTILKKLD